MKAAELRRLTEQELEAKVRDLKDNLFNLKIKHATGQLESSASVPAARRELARALTVQAERKRSA